MRSSPRPEARAPLAGPAALSPPALDDESLARWVVRRQLLDQRQLDRARQRQRLYGGTLDTAMLELGLADETSVTRALSEACGLPAAPAEWLDRPVDAAVLGLLDPAGCRRLTAQPVAAEGDRLQVVVGPGADVEQVTAWAGPRWRSVRCHVLPLVRLEALWSSLHGSPLPARHATLLGKLGGADRARRAAGERREAGRRAAGGPRVETGPAPDRPAPSAPVAPFDELGDLIMDVEEEATPPPVRLEPPPAGPTRAEASPARRAEAPAPPRAEPPAPRPPDPAPAAVSPRGPAPGAVSPPRPAQAAPPPPGTEVPAEADPTRPDAALPVASVESLLEAVERAPAGSPEQRALWRQLRPFAADPRVERLLAIWRARAAAPGEPGRQAMAVLGEVADAASVGALLDLLGAEERAARTAALTALRAATCHDLGPMRWRWNRWWGQFGGRHRVEWLLDALDGRDAGLRLAAAHELEQLSGRYVGYHFDLGKRDRDEARRRWQEWWESTRKTEEAGD
jgi:hypothetical protein